MINRPEVRISLVSLILLSCGQNTNGFQPNQGQMLAPSAGSSSQTPIDETENEASAPQQVSLPSSVSTTYSIQESSVASEPVSVAGSFLTCSYKSRLAQYGSDWTLSCELGGLEGLGQQSVSAQFEKLDAGAQAIALPASSFNRDTLTWVLKETSASAALSGVRAVVTIGDQPAFEVKTRIEASVSVAINLNYWIFNEPNNNNGNENCVEFMSAERKSILPTSQANGSGPLARYNDIPCSNQIPVLCRKDGAPAGPKWMVSSTQASYSNAAAACPSGYRFSIPLSLAEHDEVASLVDGTAGLATVWLPMNDIAGEGDFRIYFK